MNTKKATPSQNVPPAVPHQRMVYPSYLQFQEQLDAARVEAAKQQQKVDFLRLHLGDCEKVRTAQRNLDMVQQQMDSLQNNINTLRGLDELEAWLKR